MFYANAREMFYDNAREIYKNENVLQIIMCMKCKNENENVLQIIIC